MSSVYLVSMLTVVLVYYLFNSAVRQRYREELYSLDTKQYSFRCFFALGMWLFDQVRVPTGSAYPVFLYQRVVMVYGTRYAKFYLKVHWAEKILYLFMGIVVSLFFGAVSNGGWGYLPLIPLSGLLLFFLADKNLNDRAQKRKLLLMIDFPVFISKLTLLMNAGMHLRQAVERVYQDCESKSPLYVELGTVLNDMAAGMGENQAWIEFSERCKVKEISSFTSMIMQNSKIGGNQLVEELKRMTHETWEMRRHAAKQMGETASSKLIFPLMLMFLAILLIVVTPAIMQFSQGF